MIKKILFTLSLVSFCALSAASSLDKTLICIVGVKNKGDKPIVTHGSTVEPLQKLALKPACIVPFLPIANDDAQREAMVNGEHYIPDAAARIIINGIKWRLWHDEEGIHILGGDQDEEYTDKGCIVRFLLKAREIFNAHNNKITPLNFWLSVDNNKLTFERS